MTGTYGKYRGKVVSNTDRKQLGRLEVEVASVLGNKRIWALPCVPYFGKNVGFFALPPVGASVWVEFEAGDTNHPIWVGGFWEKPTDLPLSGLTADRKVFKTETVTIDVNDTKSSGGVDIKVDKKATGVPVELKVSASGVRLTVEGTTLEAGPKEIALQTGSATIKLGADSIGIEYGGSSVELRQSTVSVNKTSLQVS